jgi:hypothetical protein
MEVPHVQACRIEDIVRFPRLSCEYSQHTHFCTRSQAVMYFNTSANYEKLKAG